MYKPYSIHKNEIGEFWTIKKSGGETTNQSEMLESKEAAVKNIRSQIITDLALFPDQANLDRIAELEKSLSFKTIAFCTKDLTVRKTKTASNKDSSKNLRLPKTVR